MEHCQRFTQTMKVPRKLPTATSFSEAVTAAFTASSVPCRVSFSVLLVLGNKKKFNDARSGLYSGWASTAAPILAYNSETVSAVGVFMVQDPTVPDFFLDMSNPVAHPFEHFTVKLLVDCLSLWYKFTVNHTFSGVPSGNRC